VHAHVARESQELKGSRGASLERKRLVASDLAAAQRGAFETIDTAYHGDRPTRDSGVGEGGFLLNIINGHMGGAS
jgi:hypothetical protein